MQKTLLLIHKKLNMCLLLLVLFGLLPGYAAATDIRVCLQTSTAAAEFTVISGEYSVQGGSLKQQELATAAAGDVIKINKEAAGFTVYLNGQNIGSSALSMLLLATDNDCVMQYGTRQYRGSFSLLTNGYLLNVLDIEHYLYGVVGEEIGYNVDFEALRAQAIVARSYAAFNMGSTYYDVLAGTASQVYGGYTAESSHSSAAVRRAVDDTEGLVMYWDGDIVEAVFASSAGGYTEANENVWGGAAMPYLRAVKSPYDEEYPFYEWSVTYTPAQLKSLAETYMSRIKQTGSFGSFVRLEVSYSGADGSDTESGRVTKATIYGTEAAVTAERDAVRTMLGLKSTLFTIEGSDDAAAPLDEVYVLDAAGNLVQRSWQQLYAIGAGGEQAMQRLVNLAAAYMRSGTGLAAFNGSKISAGSGNTVVINGRGNGHGVGLSQYGAIGMAKDGYTAEEILLHYYGGDEPELLQIDYLD